MALFKHKTSGKLLLATLCQLVALSVALSRLEPPVFVIQDGPGMNLVQQQATSRQEQVVGPSARHRTQWNNAANYQTGRRSGKQIFYTDEEPTPHYSSFKYMGRSDVSHGSDIQSARVSHHFLQGEHLVAYPRRFTTGSDQQTKGGRAKTSTVDKKARPVDSRLFPSSAGKEFARQPEGNKATRGQGGRKNLVCYYGSWAVYRPDAGKFPVENIDPFLCTHLIYGFTGLSYDNLIKPLDPWNDLEDNYGKGAMRRFTGLKRQNPELKTLIAIGGWNEGSIKYSKMASEPEARAKFVSSVVEFLKKYNFDGLDLDWEYPGSRGGHSYDKQNFVKLIRELHEAFKPHGFLLTAAVSAGKSFIDPAYDIGQVGKYLDLINLMAYDYHGGWETKTGMNAPLFSSNRFDLTREDKMLNVNWSVNYWLQNGAPPEKIMLGVGSYGRSFTLDKAAENGINAPASQKGQAGPYTREPGSLGYNEICETFQRQPQAWTIVRDPDYLAPYAYNDRQWVGYDDVESLALKAQFAKSMGLGGMMMWSIETDDFSGRCHGGQKYPLLNSVRRVLDGPGSGQPGPGPGIGKPPSSTTTTMTPIVVQPTGGNSGARPKPPRPSSSTRRPGTTSRPVSTTPGRGEVEDEVVPHSTSRRPQVQTSRRPTTTTTTTTTSSTSTRRPPQPPQTGGEFVCTADGMFADPKNCRKFFRCVGSGRGNYSIYKFDCGPGTAFNGSQGYCDHIYNVPSCQGAQAPSASILGNRSSRANQSHLIAFWPAVPAYS